MGKYNATVELIDQIATDAANKGIAHLFTEDQNLFNNSITLKGKPAVNFGSCSYLGLEFDERLIQGSINEVKSYGSQFSASRAYVSTRHYGELESLFTSIFDSPSIVAPTTTLGHIAAIPVVVNDKDAVIMDHQVHHSVQTACTLLKPRGIHVELLRHNKIDQLEERIITLKQKYERIWYMADGIYSMYGDQAPILEIKKLMDKYPQFHFYVDDAHGMSCYGKHGRGYILSKIAMHPQMIFTTSLAKAFATGGAVLSFPTKELANKVRSCGGPFITSGPMQPATLGAAIASAKIHLSEEIYLLQTDLAEKIKYTNLMLKKYNLPIVSESNSAVFFVAVSLPKVGYNMIRRMLNEGYYLNLGIFPAVPMKNTGIRFTITRLHTFDQIEKMISTMAYHFPLALKEENLGLEDIYRAFKLNTPEQAQAERFVNKLVNSSQLTTKSFTSIKNVDKNLWNSLLGENGVFDWDGLAMLEACFANNELREDNWSFEYIIISDYHNKPVLATFLTTALMKDDMMAPAAVSEQIEQLRSKEGKYVFTSKVLSVGSPITEGKHLFLDRSSTLWKEALSILLDKISLLQEQHEISSTILRDLDPDDDEMTNHLVSNGFFKMSLPDNHYIESLNWNTTLDFLQNLSPSSKKHVKRYILNYEHKYNVKTISDEELAELPESRIRKYYDLYLNVKNKSFEINTFKLPFKLFKMICTSSNWEIIELNLKSEYTNKHTEELAAVSINYKTKTAYNFLLVGLNYELLIEFKPYKQLLYQIVKRANNLQLQALRMGYTTGIEKKKLGSKVKHSVAYVQAKENYIMEAIGTMSASGTKIYK